MNDASVPAATALLRKAIDHESHPHQHRHGQFIRVTQGVLNGFTERARWLLKPGAAAWIPPRITHWGTGASMVVLQVLYVDEAQAGQLPAEPALIETNALLEALLDRVLDLPDGAVQGERNSRLLALLVEEIADAPRSRLTLPYPDDLLLRRLCEQLIRTPGNRDTLDQWGHRLGASGRTLRRRFLAETGLSWLSWRQRLHLSLALTGLAEGKAVAAVAEHLGYASASAFSAWFTREMGAPPAVYRRRHLDAEG